MHDHPQIRHEVSRELRRGLDERAALLAGIERGRPWDGVALRLRVVASRLAHRRAGLNRPVDDGPVVEVPVR